MFSDVSGEVGDPDSSWRRYWWDLGTSPGWTDSYTKVERAGRTVDLRGRRVGVATLSDRDLDELERRLPSPALDAPSEPLCLGRARHEPPTPHPFGVLCEELATLLSRRLRETSA
jgi:hypothetical protein